MKLLDGFLQINQFSIRKSIINLHHQSIRVPYIKMFFTIDKILNNLMVRIEEGKLIYRLEE
jgi:hypothetical protein